LNLILICKMELLLSKASDDEKLRIFMEPFSLEVAITAIKTQSSKLVKFLLYHCLTKTNNFDVIIISVLETKNIKLIDFTLSLKKEWKPKELTLEALKLIHHYTNELNREFMIKELHLPLDDFDYLKFLFGKLNLSVKIDFRRIKSDKIFAFLVDYTDLNINELIQIAADMLFTISVDKLLSMGAVLLEESQCRLLGCCDLLWLSRKKIDMGLVRHMRPYIYDYNVLTEMIDTYQNFDGFAYNLFMKRLWWNNYDSFYKTVSKYKINSELLFEFLYYWTGKDKSERLIKAITVAIEQQIELSDNFLAYIELYTDDSWTCKYNSYIEEKRRKEIQSVIIPDIAWLITSYL